MKKIILYSLFLCSVLIVFFGCATTQADDIKEYLEPWEATLITAIDIQDYAVTITANKPFIYTIYRPGDPFKMTIELPDVSIGTFNNKIVSDKAGITELVPYQLKSPSLMAKIEILLQTPSLFEPEYKDNALKIKIKKEELAKEESGVRSQESGALEEKEEIALQRFEEKTSAEVTEVKEAEALVEGKYADKKVSLDFQDADIAPIIRLLADMSGYNIVVSPEVKGKLTMKLINVPWDQALDLILKTFSLGKSIEGNIIRIAPYALLAKESEEAAKAQEAGIKAEPLETKVFRVSYADVTKIESAIKASKALSPRGNLSIDQRTSSIIVNDARSVFPKIESLLETLDKSTPQVLIEARIVEVNTADVKDLGIQWGFFLKPTNALSSFRGYSGLGAGPFTGENFLVDFPSGSAGTGSGSGITFGILNPARTLGLDLQLAALATISKGKIISNPKIVTTDNEKAKMQQGTSEPFPKLTTEGTVSTEFKDVTLSIEVTPHITPTGSVNMDIAIKKEDILNTVNIGGSQVPRTSKVESNTKVLIEDGGTLVIGGVYKRTESESSSGVPGLMKIPILGWLFKNKANTERTAELLIFITPKIIEKTQEIN